MKITEMSKEFAEAVLACGSISHEKLEDLFNTHPTVDVFFITVDGQAFFTEEMADSHGQKLKPRDVIEISREDIMDDVFAGDDDEDATPPVPPVPPVIEPPIIVEPPVVEPPAVIEPPVVDTTTKPKKVTTPIEGEQN